jgi:hypothetical protein
MCELMYESLMHLCQEQRAISTTESEGDGSCDPIRYVTTSHGHSKSYLCCALEARQIRSVDDVLLARPPVKVEFMKTTAVDDNTYAFKLRNLYKSEWICQRGRSQMGVRFVMWVRSIQHGWIQVSHALSTMTTTTTPSPPHVTQIDVSVTTVWGNVDTNGDVWFTNATDMWDAGMIWDTSKTVGRHPIKLCPKVASPTGNSTLDVSVPESKSRTVVSGQQGRMTFMDASGTRRAPSRDAVSWALRNTTL